MFLLLPLIALLSLGPAASRPVTPVPTGLKNGTLLTHGNKSAAAAPITGDYPDHETFSFLFPLARYTAVTYCPRKELEQKSCRYCRHQDFEGMSSIKVFSARTDWLGSLQGFVAADTTSRTIVITFRGTNSKGNILLDLKAVRSSGALSLVMTAKIPDTVTAHFGFIVGYAQIKQQMISLVRASVAAYPDYDIVFTGHSLGGALANFATLDALGPSGFLEGLVPATRVSLVTFGAPRVGDADFAGLINSLPLKRSLRVVNAHDPIPRIPFVAWNYRHPIGEMFIQNREARYCDDRQNNGEDTDCASQIPDLMLNIVTHLDYFGSTLLSACTGGIAEIIKGFIFE